MYDDEREQKGKAYAGLGAMNQAMPAREMKAMEAGCVDSSSSRRSIRRRIDEALRAAEVTARRAEAAYRAKNIIESHPEFAELLDALDQF